MHFSVQMSLTHFQVGKNDLQNDKTTITMKRHLLMQNVHVFTNSLDIFFPSDSESMWKVSHIVIGQYTWLWKFCDMIVEILC